MANTIDQNRIRQVFFILLLLLLGLLLFTQLYSFIPAVLGAITIYILLRRWMIYLTEKRNGGRAGLQSYSCCFHLL